MEIAPNVHCIAGRIVNCYLIVDADGLALIDAGLPGDAKKILAYIASMGKTPADLRRIIITHADGDHVGGVAALKAASGATVYASAPEAQAMAAGRASRKLKPTGVFKFILPLTARLFQAPVAQADEILSDGQTLPVLGGLRVVFTPGHTPGHVSLFASSAGILFVGDSLVASNGALRGSRGMNTWDQVQADLAVKKQAALGALLVCPGHGAVIHEAMEKFPRRDTRQ